MTRPSASGRSARARERGTALVAVFFLVLVLGGLSVGLLEEGLAARGGVAHHERCLAALEVAEAGIVHAEAEIRAQADWGSDGIGNQSGACGDGAFAVTARTDPVSDDRWVLRSQGTSGRAVRRIEVGIRRREERRFVESLFSQEDLTLGGNTSTDSYDSRLGTWASQASNWDAGGAYADVGGDVGSNGAVTLSGSSVYVRGNAIPGPLQEVTVSGSPLVTGDMVPREFALETSPPPYEEFLAAYTTNSNAALPTNRGAGAADPGNVRYDARGMSLTITGGADVTLTSGTYFFSDLSLLGESTLRIDGSVRIYVTGSFDLGGGTLLNPGSPCDLLVYAHPYALPPGDAPTSTTVRVRGGAQTALGVYAPEADFSVLGGGDFFGSAVAGSISVAGDTRFHYDRALQTVGATGVATMERLWWRDLSRTRR